MKDLPQDVWMAAKTLWSFHARGDLLLKADVIVGLGSYDLRVAERCADLFAAEMAPQILFTGASGNWTDAMFSGSEAEAFAAHALASGVPQAALHLEEQARNIGENMRLSAKMMPDVRRVILVTKPQTQMRCRATALKQWPEVESMVTAPHTPFEDQPLPHHGLRALICEMVGDLERIRTYPELGFQTPVHIPPSVAAAFGQLVAAGFVDHMP